MWRAILKKDQVSVSATLLTIFINLAGCMFVPKWCSSGNLELQKFDEVSFTPQLCQ